LLTCAVFLPNSRTFATWGHQSKLRFWDLGVKKHLKSFSGSSNSISALDVSADGRLLIVAGYQQDEDFALGRVEVWDIGTGRSLAQLRASGGAVSCVKLSPDGQWLAAGTE